MTFKPGQSGNPKGRTPTSVKHAGAITKAEKQIADRLPQLIENMFLLADGVLVEELIDGKPFVFKRPPDRAANEYLLNRIMGKPTERQEHSGPDGGAIPVGFNQMLGRVYGDDSSDPKTELPSE